MNENADNYDPQARWRDDTRTDDELFHAVLTEKDDDARGDAVFVLRWRGTRDIFDQAVSLCGSRKAAERWEGVNILGKFRDPGRELGNPYRAETVDLMLGLLGREKRITVLCVLLWALEELDDDRAIAPIITFGQHPNKWVRRNAAVALGHFACRDEPAQRALIELCRDHDRYVRDWATFELSLYEPDELDLPEAHAVLWERAAENDSEIRCEALRGLAFRGETGLTDLLIRELTSDEFYDDVLEAAECLADPALLPYLLPLREWEQINEACLDDAIAACGGESETKGAV